MLLINEQTDISALKPDHLYFLLEQQVTSLHHLLNQDGAASTGTP